MSRIIEEIILKLGVDLTGMENDVANAADSLDGLADATEDYEGSAKKAGEESSLMGGAITGMAAAAAAATAVLGVMIAKNIEAQTETMQMAQALGVGAQRLQDLQNVGVYLVLLLRI